MTANGSYQPSANQRRMVGQDRDKLPKIERNDQTKTLSNGNNTGYDTLMRRYDLYDSTSHGPVILRDEHKNKMQKYLIIILPWGKYVYLKMPMVLNISSNVFQWEHSRLFQGMPFVLVDIDDILIISKRTFEQHMIAVKYVLVKLQKIDIQLNVNKSHFATIEVDYLCYIINRTGIIPQSSKVQLIVGIPRDSAAW